MSKVEKVELGSATTEAERSALEEIADWLTSAKKVASSVRRGDRTTADLRRCRCKVCAEALAILKGGD